MFVLKFQEPEKAVLMAALDVYVRQIGADLNKVGGNGSADAAMKLIAAHNMAIAIQNAVQEETAGVGQLPPPQ